MSRAVIEAAGALRRALSDFDPAILSASDAAALADELSLTEKACAAARALAGARAAACGAHRERGFSDPASWLAHQAGTTPRQAKEALLMAAALEACPATKDALLAGEVSISQAQEIVRCAAELPGAESELLDVARRGDLAKVRDEAREKRLSSTPVDELHRRQLEARRFRHWRDGLGMLCFDGALPPETGIPLVNRIEREAARQRADAKRRGCAARFEAHAADALVALSAGGGAGPKGRTDLVIVCDLHAWRRGHAHDGEPCHLIGGGPIPVEVAKRLSEDAFVKIVLHDGVDIRKIRHVGRKYTAELRTALDLGPAPSFGGRACVDCGRTWGLQHDHTDPVAHTGPTSMDNVVDRCWPCHADKTERDRRAGLLRQKAKPGARAGARGSRLPGDTSAPMSDGLRRGGDSPGTKPPGRDPP